MTGIPVCSGLECARALEKAGFVCVGHGKHPVYKKDGCPKIPVPAHRTALKRGTLSNIIKSAGLTYDQFRELLK